MLAVSDPVSVERDHKVKSKLQSVGLSVQSFNADLLYEPWEVSDVNGLAFTTFNEFWSKCLDLPVDLTSALPPWRLIPVSGTSCVHLGNVIGICSCKL
jgi:cryptochrome 2